jgi:hypothetical protein
MSHNNNGFNNTPEQYKVTRLFLSGDLTGITYSEIWTSAPQVGFECHNPIGGSPYRIVSVQKIS